MPKAIVLGGYGLIGQRCCRALLAAGFHVTAIGRSGQAAQRSGLAVDWLIRDIAHTDAHIWRRDLAGADIVVNCAGALQDGLRDDLDAIHVHAVTSFVTALEGSGARVIQISAAGVSPDADTGFFRSKAQGDARLMESGLDWVILRPTLVIGSAAYGGTALLRAVASIPGVNFRVLAEARVQTVWIEDVAQAVVSAACGEIRSGTIADLTERDCRSFDDTVRQFRRWLGLRDRRFDVTFPGWTVALLSRGADLLGWLGWRSPLRSNGLRSLKNGITGDPKTWETVGGNPCRGLEQTLAAIPATLQERWFARMYLLLPLAIAALALFWIATGIIALARYDEAKLLLTARGMGSHAAAAVVLLGSFVDLVLGCAVLVRKWASRAALGMAAASMAYIVGSLTTAPDLWLDPVGPMLKVLPSIPLALIVAALMDER